MWSAGGFEVKKSGCGRFEAILVEHREEENVILAIALLHGLIGELYETHWVVVVNSIEEGRAVEKELNTFLDSGFVSGSRIARKSV